MLGTVVIPAFNRQSLTQRAFESVLQQPSSDQVQIIIVDDSSDAPIQIGGLRSQDVIIRNESRVGAAVSRNRGIDAASGEIIYLLDSDDYFESRDYLSDLEALRAQPGIIYSALRSGSYRSNYPSAITRSGYLPAVLGTYPFLCQTSTLCFSCDLGLRFDETLPKHQDWDFVFSALCNGISVRHGPGLVHFDRTDKSSISRSRGAERSIAWLAKLDSQPSLDFPLPVIELLVTGRTEISKRGRTGALLDTFRRMDIPLESKVKMLAKLALRAF